MTRYNTKVSSEDPYDGSFIDTDKLTDVTRDIIANIEKWKLSYKETNIVIDEVKKYTDHVEHLKMKNSLVEKVKASEQYIEELLGDKNGKKDEVYIDPYTCGYCGNKFEARSGRYSFAANQIYKNQVKCPNCNNGLKNQR